VTGLGRFPTGPTREAAVLVAVLRKLHTYRGDSRFTTWAYKFALLEAAVKLRKRPWHGREVPLDADGWTQLVDDRRAPPYGPAEASELIDAVRAAIAEALSSHQRAVLVAVTLNDVPIDVLACVIDRIPEWFDPTVIDPSPPRYGPFPGRLRITNAGDEAPSGQAPADESGKTSRAGDAKTYMTSTHPSVAALPPEVAHADRKADA
jgi:hypothetical protein